MRIRKIVFVIFILLVMSLITFFIYTRFYLNIYELKDNGNILIIKNSIYNRSNSVTISDEENLGKTLGIAIEGKRTIK
jgi:hypothetical protein